jgi:hypothetical protein
MQNIRDLIVAVESMHKVSKGVKPRPKEDGQPLPLLQREDLQLVCFDVLSGT